MASSSISPASQVVSEASADQLDVSFSVRFNHRVRFTHDVCNQDVRVLTDLVESEVGILPRVVVLCETALRRSTSSIDSLHEQLVGSRSFDLPSPLIDIAGGESIKQDSHAVEFVLRIINECNLDRRSYVVAIGGGAFLDAVGYAAAIAHRGVRLIRLPTTTLAQADSGVGVKNAINFFGKKNWVGTFAVPWAVINDAKLLETLPDSEFRCGFAEAVKVSALKSVVDFNWLVENADAIARRDMSVATEAIKQSCLMHLRHITHGGDPFESLEARPLDFGHWSAHRLEALSDYQVSHGQAVAIGVALDSIYSSLVHGLPEPQMHQICNALHRLGLDLWHPKLDDRSHLLQGLEEFRQHLGGRLTVTMLRQIGQPIDVHSIDIPKMHNALDRLKSIATK
jgi:3-dehydroquinate synthase